LFEDENENENENEKGKEKENERGLPAEEDALAAVGSAVDVDDEGSGVGGGEPAVGIRLSLAFPPMSYIEAQGGAQFAGALVDGQVIDDEFVGRQCPQGGKPAQYLR
jgi:hypothetical protein